MAILIQKIRTDWTKDSRGNPGATARNRIPDIFPIDLMEFVDGVLFQEIRYGGGSVNKPRIKGPSTINNFQVREQRLEFNHVDEGLAVGFWTEDQIRKHIGILDLNSWCQIKTNRRYILDYSWGYYKIVYNIFYGEMRKASDIVLTRDAKITKDYQSLLI